VRSARILKGDFRWSDDSKRRRRESNPCTGLCRPQDVTGMLSRVIALAAGEGGNRDATEPPTQAPEGPVHCEPPLVRLCSACCSGLAGRAGRCGTQPSCRVTSAGRAGFRARRGVRAYVRGARLHRGGIRPGLRPPARGLLQEIGRAPGDDCFPGMPGRLRRFSSSGAAAIPFAAGGQPLDIACGLGLEEALEHPVQLRGRWPIGLGRHRFLPFVRIG
jgi:hypothetical protein